MKLDLITITFVTSLLLLAQVVAASVQYKVNRVHHGIGWWLTGTGLMALGSMLMPLVAVPSLRDFARISVPLLVLGYVFLNLAVNRFLGRAERRVALALMYGAFLLAYYFFMFSRDSISARTVVVCVATAAFSLLTARSLLVSRLSAARFTALVFAAYGLFSLVRIYPTLTSPAIRGYSGMAPIHVAAFLIPMLCSTLWTFGFILMVNQRLNAENIEEKETYRSILEASPDDITITDLEGRILMVSPAAVRIFGFSEVRALGRRITDFLVPGDVERARANIAGLGHGNPHAPHEYRGVREDGGLLDIEVNSALIRDAEGVPARMVFVVRDITGRKRTEREKAELETRNNQLRKAESLGRMAGAIAHHFNNQLQVVMASLDLAGPSPLLDQARSATERATHMGRLMLAYLGQTAREQEPLRLSGLCAGSLPALSATLPAGVTLEARCPSPGPLVRADADQLRVVLANLVTNAWEAMEGAPGAITLEVSTVAGASIPSRNRFPVDWLPREGDYARLEVADTGAGIPEGDFFELFDPFFSTRFTGRGLGLPVVLGIVQAHGGAVCVESRPGRGSAFRVHLPLLAATTPQAGAGR